AYNISHPSFERLKAQHFILDAMGPEKRKELGVKSDKYDLIDDYTSLITEYSKFLKALETKIK
ncbi:MAG: hypothetical protein ABIH99_05060, partial [Candidatus Micrarchaeota archaeon]